MNALQDVLAAPDHQNPRDASSDARRARVRVRNALADVRQLGRKAAVALILAKVSTKPSASSEPAAQAKVAAGEPATGRDVIHVVWSGHYRQEVNVA